MAVSEIKFLNLVGSTDMLDFIPNMTISDDTNAMPIDCWQDVCLSKIWIPSSLLPSRKKASNSRTTQGVFHTLKKRGHDRCIESFSTYSDPDDEADQSSLRRHSSSEEIFLSDSDDDILSFDAVSNKKHARIENAGEKYESDCYKNASNLKSMPSINDLHNISEEYKNLASSFEKIMNDRLTRMTVDNSINKTYQNDENSSVSVNYRTTDLKSTCIYSGASGAVNMNHKTVDSCTSLNEILDSSSDIDMRSFTFEKDEKYVTKHETLELNEVKEQKLMNNRFKQMEVDNSVNLNHQIDENSSVFANYVESNLKSDIYSNVHKAVNVTNKIVDSELSKKKDKRKKKTAKSVTLDKFLEDYSESDKQDDYCNDYFNKLMSVQNDESNVKLRSTVDFPNLAPKELKFMHSDVSSAKQAEVSVKTLTEVLMTSNDVNENQCVVDDEETQPLDPVTSDSVGKIVIENIPSEVCQDDVMSLLCGYGEIMNFCLEPDGDFLKAFVKIDLVGDIDWIIDCLNGTEPFGASSRVLRCYKQNID